MTDQSATTGVTDRPHGTGVAGTTASTTGPIGSTDTPILDHLDHSTHSSPCLVVDLAVVRRRHEQLRATLPDARICYAVKANPMPEVVGELVGLGASFDVASTGEIDLCLEQGAAPEDLSYGNPIKKPADISYAYARGVRLFATDSEPDLDAIADAAPGASVFCRVHVDNTGSRTPFGRKFGCSPEHAARLLTRAHELGLDAYGVSFHIGSQQLEPHAWEHGLAAGREVFDRAAGLDVRMVNIGGGLPAAHTDDAPELADYAARIESSLDRHFGTERPELLVEPGRYLVGDAGVLRSEVVLATEDRDPDHRWIYLDVGRYRGLAETEGEAIGYRIRTSRDGDPVGPAVLAGPTCDGDDVLYQHNLYDMPVTLRAGDHVDLLSAGAYTASYSSVCFNGFTPLATHCFDSERRERP